jgi:hypothetical protein
VILGAGFARIRVFQRFRKNADVPIIKYYLPEIHKWLKIRRNSQIAHVMF